MTLDHRLTRQAAVALVLTLEAAQEQEPACQEQEDLRPVPVMADPVHPAQSGQYLASVMAMEGCAVVEWLEECSAPE